MRFPIQVEELNSELDLRLHLHQPRPARAEQDVHNVRAGKASRNDSITVIMVVQIWLSTAGRSTPLFRVKSENEPRRTTHEYNTEL